MTTVPAAAALKYTIYAGVISMQCVTNCRQPVRHRLFMPAYTTQIHTNHIYIETNQHMVRATVRYCH